jgi:uncharacterized membrane protein (DUF373 family)
MSPFNNDNFLRFIYRVENFVSKILSIALVVVILVAVFDLLILLGRDLLTSIPEGYLNKALIEVFGLFLNILIALELLENLTAYLKKHVVQAELVVVTALIAIARKIVIFDPEKLETTDLIALALAALALSASYWLLRRTSHAKE